MSDSSARRGSGGSNSPIVNTETWSVRWGDLFTVMVTAVSTAFFESLAAVVAELLNLIIRPLNAVANLLNVSISGLTTGLESTISFGAAEPLVETFGIFGAFAIVLTGIWLLAIVVRRVG